MGLTTTALLALLLAVGLWGWFSWLPAQRPALHRGEKYGIDVSSHQGSIAWNQVARDHIAVAYAKATEGGDYVDTRFADNWRAIHAAGLERGAYHFFTLCASGEAQAANFLRTVPIEPDALPAAVDLELGGNCERRPSRTQVESDVSAFLTRVEARTGHPVILYVGDSFERRYQITAAFRRPRWVVRLLRRPTETTWRLWQASGFAHVDGVRGRVDLDVVRDPG